MSMHFREQEAQMTNMLRENGQTHIETGSHKLSMPYLHLPDKYTDSGSPGMVGGAGDRTSLSGGRCEGHNQ